MRGSWTEPRHIAQNGLSQARMFERPDSDNLEDREAREAFQGVVTPVFGLACNPKIITAKEP